MVYSCPLLPTRRDYYPSGQEVSGRAAAGEHAVVKVTPRQREQPAGPRVRDGLIVLQALLGPDEVREFRPVRHR